MNLFRSTQDTPRNAVVPYFPTYLLPTLKIPLLKRRRSSATATPASNNDVPSLSSSPTSTVGTDDDEDDGLPSSPTSASGPYALPPVPGDKVTSQASRQQRQQRQQQAQPSRRDSDAGELHRLARRHPDTLRCGSCGTDVAYGLQVVSKGFTGRHGRALLVSAPLLAPTPSCPGSPPPHPPSPLTTPSTTTAGTNLVNVAVGRPEARTLVTGPHVVADITCAACGAKIGWKYVDAREAAQKYKIGKFILETERVVLHRSWEDGPAASAAAGERGSDHHFYSSSAPAGSSPLSGAGGSGRRRSSGSASATGTGSGSAGGRGASFSPGGAGILLEEDDEEGEDEGEEEVSFDSDDDDECEDIFAGVWDAATVARRRGSRVGGGGGGYPRAVTRGWAVGRGR